MCTARPADTKECMRLFYHDDLDPEDCLDRGPGCQPVHHNRDGHAFDRSGPEPAADELAADGSRSSNQTRTADLYVFDIGVCHIGEDLCLATGSGKEPVVSAPHVVPLARDYLRIWDVPAEEGTSRRLVLAAITMGGSAAAIRSLAIEYASQGIRIGAHRTGITAASTLQKR
jgi:hypothetical protein